MLHIKRIFFLFFLALSSIVSGSTYYVATTGSDKNPGTLEKPWATWQKAVRIAFAGDTVYIRGGIYYATEMVLINVPYNGHNGTSVNPVCFFSYPGEIPILDGTNKTSPSGGILVQDASYLYFKGLTVRNNFQMEVDYANATGIVFEGCNNIIAENCVTYNNGMRGFHLSQCDNIKLLNCDSYNNYDRLSSGYEGGAGDGFLITNYYEADTGTSVTLTGCRAWHNSDDGFDTNSEGYVEFNNCWSCSNGYDMGDGTGFKFGHMDYTRTGVDRRLANCLAAFNAHYGFNENNGTDLPSLYRRMNLQIFNNTAYSNGEGGFVTWFRATGSEVKNIYRNNLSYKNTNSFDGQFISDHNSWDASTSVTVTDADFKSIDSTGITGARKYDGSLPDLDFLKPASTSDLIDAGIDVGLPYYDSAPDLGYSEYLSGPIIPPSPIYLSSVIENSTPARLEMTYNLTLASIVPDASAFDVKVKNENRSVSSVAISGTKVLLTLSSPVAYGDLVTVAYTKPSSNPIQTPLHGEASSLSAQNVVNRVGNNTPPAAAITVYPNPAQEFVTIRIDESTLEPDSFHLIDLSGITIITSELDPDIREFTVFFSLPNGIYFIHLSSGKSTSFIQKFVVSR